MKFFLWLLLIAMVIVVGVTVKRGRGSSHSEPKSILMDIKTADDLNNLLIGSWEFDYYEKVEGIECRCTGKVQYFYDGTFVKYTEINIKNENNDEYSIIFSGSVKGHWKARRLWWGEDIEDCTLKETYRQQGYRAKNCNDTVPCYIIDKDLYGNADLDNLTSRFVEMTTTSMRIEGKTYAPQVTFQYTLTRINN